MGNLLLVVSAVGVAAMLIAFNYPDLANYAEYRANKELYDAIAEAEPIFEPRVIEPRVDPPDLERVYSAAYGTSGSEYIHFNRFGYTSAEHNPEDDSVTLTYDYTTSGQLCRTCGDGSEGVYVRTYMPGQTFVYFCSDSWDYTKVLLAQYRGTNMAQEVRRFVFVHFEVRIPEIIPCMFPDYLTHTVDIYDTGDFDRLYDLSTYETLQDGTPDHDVYAEMIRRPLIISPIYVDGWVISRLGEDRGLGGMSRGAMYNSDNSVTIIYQEQDPETGKFIPDTDHARTYFPGQTFLVDCRELEDTTYITVFNYRGSKTIPDDKWLVFANFRAYTHMPVPCTLPDYLDYATDAFDPDILDRQYDMEWHREILANLE